MLRLSLLFCLVFCLGVAPVLACTAPANYFDATLEEQVNAASLIVVGMVTEAWAKPDNTEYDSSYQIELEVSNYLKGSGSTIIVIDYVGGYNRCPDAYVPAVGTELIAFLVERGGILYPYYWGRQTAFRTVSDNLIAQITGNGNPINTPQPLPITTQTARFIDKYDDWIFWSILTLGAILGISLLIRHFIKRGKSKAKREILS